MSVRVPITWIAAFAAAFASIGMLTDGSTKLGLLALLLSAALVWNAVSQPRRRA